MDVDIYADGYTAKRQAKRAVKEQVKYRLDELINPDDVNPDAETWADVDEDLLREEVGRCAEVMVNEGQLHAVEDLAIVLWREQLPRVSMDHMVFDTHRDAVRAGYWPYDMSRTDVTDELMEFAEEFEYFHEVRDDAEGELGPSIMAALHPQD